MPAAPPNFSIQALKAAGLPTARALSGRNAGYTLVFSPLARIFLWRSSESAGSSVVHTTATLALANKSLTRREASCALASFQTDAALEGFSRTSIPKKRFNSRCVQW